MESLLNIYSTFLESLEARRIRLIEITTYLDIEKGIFWPNSEQHLKEEFRKRLKNKDVSDIDMLLDIFSLIDTSEKHTRNKITSFDSTRRLYNKFKQSKSYINTTKLNTSPSNKKVQHNLEHPTEEQQLVIEKLSKSDSSIKLQGYAGCGKTSVVKMAYNDSHDELKKSSYYMSFNKGIVRSVESSIPGIHATTLDAIGYRLGLSGSLWEADDVGLNKLSNTDISQYLGIQPSHHLDGNKGLKGNKISKLAGLVVDNFSGSVDDEISDRHIPNEIIDPSARQQILLHSNNLWNAILTNSFGKGKKCIPPSYVTKYWSMSGGRLPDNCQRLYLDEAQDLNGSFLNVIERSKGVQIIAAGDHFQQLYGWRGAVNSMRRINGDELSVTKSFRFGGEISILANLVLAKLKESTALDITPFDKNKPSQVLSYSSKPSLCDVILTRGRASVFSIARGLARSETSYYLNLDFS